MGQEFTIKSEAIESKINQLLPSQGGYGAGIDFSASTTVIPIVDLTETAEGSSLRQDLQTAVDFATSRTEVINASNTTVVNTTGFFKVDINVTGLNGSATINIFDGTTSKIIKFYDFQNNALNIVDSTIVYLRAGDSLRASSSNGTTGINLFTRQIADVSGNLTSPLGFV